MAGPGPPDGERPLVQRLGWFILLWVCGIVTVGLIAFLIRSVLL